MAHLLLILSLSFELPRYDPKAHETPPLEVMVLRNPRLGEAKPDKPDALAQVDQTGAGEGDAARPTDIEAGREQETSPETTPLPAPEVAAIPPQPLTAPSPPEESTLTAALDQSPPQARTGSRQPTTPPPAVSAAQILASRSQEIARLAARIEESSAAYANRPRRKSVSASTQEYRYATYLEAWRRKVERIGNLNYPEEAKRRRLYGSLILQVSVRADGSLEEVRVLRSSGFDVLDKAAVRIVKLAAPFAPLPRDIRAEADVLDITRTWQFLSSNRLGWEK